MERGFEINISPKDVARAVGDIALAPLRFITERVTGQTAWPIVEQRGAEAMLDQQLSLPYDSDPYAYDVVQRPPENAGDWDSLRGV